MKCKAIEDNSTASPLHLSFKQNDLIVIENKIDQNYWVTYVLFVENIFGKIFFNYFCFYLVWIC